MGTKGISERVVRKLHEAIESVAGPLGDAARASLLAAAADIIDAEVRLERERCIEICRARAELWTNTMAAKSSIASARDEARARANEATYVADLLASELRFHIDSRA